MSFCPFCETLYQKKEHHMLSTAWTQSFFIFLFFFFVDSKSQCFNRHTLNYLQEIGNGWFGKVRRSPLTIRVKLNQVHDKIALLPLVSSWALVHVNVHPFLLGDPGWSAVWLQLLSGRGEGAARQCQPSGAEKVLGRVGAVQVGETAEARVAIFGP